MEKIQKENVKAELLLKAIDLSSLPSTIYKYRSIDYNNAESRTEQIIKENELWFASPKSLNDPFDCQIEPEISDDYTKHELFYLMENELFNSMKGEPFQITPSLLEELSVKAMKDFTNNSGICSFSEKWDSILQWGYYANGHSGICFGFELEKDSEYFSDDIVKVKYVKDYPRLVLFTEKNPCFAQIVVGTKFEQWKHEEEIRVVKEASANLNLKFKKESLTEIIFGLKCSEDDIKKTQILLKQYNYHNVKFFKTKIKKRQYGIERIELSNS